MNVISTEIAFHKTVFIQFLLDFLFYEFLHSHIPAPAFVNNIKVACHNDTQYQGKILLPSCSALHLIAAPSFFIRLPEDS